MLFRVRLQTLQARVSKMKSLANGCLSLSHSGRVPLPEDAVVCTRLTVLGGLNECSTLPCHVGLSPLTGRPFPG